MKYAYNGISGIDTHPNGRQITGILSVVERLVRKPGCSSGKILTCSNQSLRRRTMIFSRILLACATREIRMRFPHFVIPPFVENLERGLFPLLRILTHPSKSDEAAFVAWEKSPSKSISDSSRRTLSNPSALPFPELGHNQFLNLSSKGFLGHWSNPRTMFESSFSDFVFRRAWNYPIHRLPMDVRL